MYINTSCVFLSSGDILSEGREQGINLNLKKNPIAPKSVGISLSKQDKDLFIKLHNAFAQAMREDKDIGGLIMSITRLSFVQYIKFSDRSNVLVIIDNDRDIYNCKEILESFIKMYPHRHEVKYLEFSPDF